MLNVYLIARCEMQNCFLFLWFPISLKVLVSSTTGVALFPKPGSIEWCGRGMDSGVNKKANHTKEYCDIDLLVCQSRTDLVNPG